MGEQKSKDTRISLNEIIPIDESEYADWTICLNNAPTSWDTNQFVYSFDQDKERLMTHISWHKSFGKKAFRNIYTKYCLQFIRLDKDSKYNRWLFLGAFENRGIVVREDRNELYDLVPIDRFSSFNERLVIAYQKHQGDTQAKIDIRLIKDLKVVEILENRYAKANRQFDGYDCVSLSFAELKSIINANVDNWRELLSNINAVYVITDLSNGKLYIGSTYGKKGVWQRWSCYVETDGHGNNVELKQIIEKDPNYAIKHFQFSIIETFLNDDDKNKHIQERERYWKEVLNTFSPHGYNDNK